MDITTALHALSALGHDTRLNTFRQLVAAQPQGLAAGQLAERLGVVPNTLSAHLNILHQAGLVDSRREGRLIVYSARMETMNGLIDFLTQDCCGGRPELCRPADEECCP